MFTVIDPRENMTAGPTLDAIVTEVRYNLSPRLTSDSEVVQSVVVYAETVQTSVAPHQVESYEDALAFLEGTQWTVERSRRSVRRPHGSAQ